MEKLKEIPNKLNICIDVNQCKEAQLSCLLHETLEALTFHYGLELSHKTISILEAGLFQVIKDNFSKQERSKS